jgi:hypothetical protein
LNLKKAYFNKLPVLIFLAAGSLIMMKVMVQTGATLKTPSTPLGILNLEFAYTAEKALAVILAWTGLIPADNVLAAIVNTWLDFIFLLFYSLFLYQACRMLSLKHTRLLSTAGHFIAKGALIAGLLDVFENIGMLLTLNGYISNTVALLTFLFSIVKWLLVLAAVLYILIAGLWLLYGKVLGKA